MAGTAPTEEKVQESKLQVAVIPIDSIKRSEVALRDVVKDSEEYLGLVDSIKQKGILNPIVVRELPSSEDGKRYGLIDGLHRWNAAMDAGLTEIPVRIKNMTDAEIEEAQIVANVHRIETKPVQYTKQLKRLMVRNPLMTMSELAGRLSKSYTWLYKRFGLLDLTKEIQDMVDEEKLKLSNAFELSKLPDNEQKLFLPRAITTEPVEFTGIVAQRIKELKEAKRTGDAAKPPGFTPIPKARKWPEIKVEFENPSVGPNLIRQFKITDPEKAFALAVAWVANMDPVTQEERKQRNEIETKKSEEDKKKREIERQQKRLADAQQKLAAAGINEAPKPPEPALASA